MAAAANDPGAASGVLAPRLVRLARHDYPDRLLVRARAQGQVVDARARGLSELEGDGTANDLGRAQKRGGGKKPGLLPAHRASRRDARTRVGTHQRRTLV